MKKMLPVVLPILLFGMLIWTPCLYATWRGDSSSYSIAGLDTSVSDGFILCVVGFYILPIVLLGTALFKLFCPAKGKRLTAMIYRIASILLLACVVVLVLIILTQGDSFYIAPTPTVHPVYYLNLPLAAWLVAVGFKAYE